MIHIEYRQLTPEEEKEINERIEMTLRATPEQIFNWITVMQEHYLLLRNQRQKEGIEIDQQELEREVDQWFRNEYIKKHGAI